MAINGSGLADYLANQIFQGKLSYEAVIKKYPAYKDTIDEVLKSLNIVPTVDED